MDELINSIYCNYSQTHTNQVYHLSFIKKKSNWKLEFYILLIDIKGTLTCYVSKKLCKLNFN